jgi:transcriptional regulator GlxA family with amidase domain
MTPLAEIARVAFLTLPNYSMIACSAAIEALRMANYVAGRPVYQTEIVTLDGAPALASGGYALSPTKPLSPARIDALIVCGGVDVRHAVDRRTLDELRRLDRRGVALGALCTGTFALAEADLLDGYRCAIHWENLSAIREEFENVGFVEDLFVIDRDRFTCTGGIAPLDMMAAFIEARLGPAVADKVLEQFIVPRRRYSAEPQHAPLGGRITHPALEDAARVMARTIGAPLPMAAVAQRIGFSTRQLERLFRRHLDISPAEFYTGLRLDRARELLRLSGLAVTDVGIACGFGSAAHFSAAYHRRFGHSPRRERAGAAGTGHAGTLEVGA